MWTISHCLSPLTLSLPRCAHPKAEMRDWVDFSAVKQAVSLEAVLRHYQVPGHRHCPNAG